MTHNVIKDMHIHWLENTIDSPNAQAHSAAEQRQKILTKPAGALGLLEDAAIQLAAMQGVENPQVNNVHIAVFAGDHGIATEGVSAFPQAVTAEMVKNFARGGAAICVAARTLNADLEVINLGTAFPTGELQNVIQYNLGLGTANFAVEAAMNEKQVSAALHAGRESVQRAVQNNAELFIGGEMGIANTSSATALASVLLNIDVAQLSGPGTGLDNAGVDRKTAIIEKAIGVHQEHLDCPLEILRRLGGFEIAALAGAYISAAHHHLPIFVDGFISSAAALLASRLAPGAEQWMLFAHASAEPGHRSIMHALNARPLLDIGMRLGEGSGAAIAVPLLRMACALHNDMATFAEAEVSEKVSEKISDT